jgi:hypothetical protein
MKFFSCGIIAHFIGCMIGAVQRLPMLAVGRQRVMHFSGFAGRKKAPKIIGKLSLYIIFSNS